MSVSRNISFAYLFQVLNTGLGFIASVFITRLLGAEGRGDYSLFTNSLALATIWFGFSLPSSVIFFVASKKYTADKVLNTMTVITAITTFVVLLILRLLNKLQLGWLVLPAQHHGFGWEAIFLAQFFLTQMSNMVVAILNASKIFIPSLKINSLTTFLSVVLWVLLYFKIIQLPFDSFGAILVIGTGILFFQVIANFIALFKSGFRPSLALLDLKALTTFIQFAVLIYLCNAIQFLSYRMDLWFVSFFRGKASTGIYSLAATLAQLIWILPNSIASVLYAYISGSSTQEALEYLVKYIRVSFYASLALAMAAFVFFYFAIPVVYGPAFTPSVLMLGILLLGIAPFSIPIIIGNFFTGVKQVRFNLWASLLGFVVCLVLDITLIPRFGAIGACIATVISYLTNTLYCSYILNKVFKQPINLSPVRFIKEDVQVVVQQIRLKFGLT